MQLYLHHDPGEKQRVSKHFVPFRTYFLGGLQASQGATVRDHSANVRQDDKSIIPERSYRLICPVVSIQFHILTALFNDRTNVLENLIDTIIARCDHFGNDADAGMLRQYSYTDEN